MSLAHLDSGNMSGHRRCSGSPSGSSAGCLHRPQPRGQTGRLLLSWKDPLLWKRGEQKTQSQCEPQPSPRAPHLRKWAASRDPQHGEDAGGTHGAVATSPAWSAQLPTQCWGHCVLGTEGALSFLAWPRRTPRGALARYGHSPEVGCSSCTGCFLILGSRPRGSAAHLGTV